ncbi:MAG: AMP-binding protein [Pseudomonadota bacterium]|nr:AMP-binding protein [Pseudomonadota bacterium]
MAEELTVSIPALYPGASPTLFGPAAVRTRKLSDGSLLLDNALPLPEYPSSLLERFDHWVERRPDQVFLAERASTGWHEVSYAQAQQQIDGLARSLLPLELSVDRPLMVMSANSVGHALIVLAAMRIGVPAAVVSPQLGTSMADPARLHATVATLTPGAIYCGAGIDHRVVAAALGHLGVPLLVGADIEEPGFTPLHALDRCSSALVSERYRSLSPDSPAKILFTSGSTGLPKGVIVTQRMMCSNAAALGSVWPLLLTHPPQLLDWLPWSHVFGGNCCFNVSLYYGGSFFIDDGRPIGAGMARTVENLRLSAPNLYFNVPLGFDLLAQCLESDDKLARRFLSGLLFMFNAGAALPAKSRAALEAIAVKTLGRCPPIIGAWGSTETAPFATVVYFDTRHADNLGIPIPGTTVKMLPHEGRFELRVKGPNVTPGYWRRPDLTRQAFDADGFYRIGDAGRFADAAHPEAGIRFEGRVAENFKLTSGTWVNVGVLRVDLLDALKPYVEDVVITGHGRDTLGLLVFPSITACRVLVGADADGLDSLALVQHPAVIDAVRHGLRQHSLGQRGSSTRIERFVILHDPPSREKGERTEKGSLNQRAVLTARAADVEALYRTGQRVEILE